MLHHREHIHTTKKHTKACIEGKHIKVHTYKKHTKAQRYVPINNHIEPHLQKQNTKVHIQRHYTKNQGHFSEVLVQRQDQFKTFQYLSLQKIMYIMTFSI